MDEPTVTYDAEHDTLFIDFDAPQNYAVINQVQPLVWRKYRGTYERPETTGVEIREFRASWLPAALDDSD